MLWRSTIQTENPGKPAGFQPQTQEAQAGDAIFWVNDDVRVEHQPYPTAGDPNTWCNVLRGSERSDSIALANAGTIEYLCAIHPGETGTIVVANAIDIGRTADDEVFFIPVSLPINQGESVSWSNSDSEAHQPAPVGEPATTWFAEPVPSGTVSATVAFPNAGTVQYECALHPNEQGSIVVTAPAPPAPAS